MAKAAAELEERGEAVTSRALAAAHISREYRMHLAPGARNGRDGIESLVFNCAYTTHSTSHKIPAVEKSACTKVPERTPAAADPPEALPSPSDGELLLPVLPSACSATSHQLTGVQRVTE